VAYTTLETMGTFCVVYLLLHFRLSIFEYRSTYTVTTLTYTYKSLPIVYPDLTVIENRLRPSAVPPTDSWRQIRVIVPLRPPR
jgi:hypothetical protein